MPRFALLMTVPILLSACSGGSNGEDDGAPSACSVSSQKQAVLEIMEFYYFWNDEPAQQEKYDAINLDDFEDIWRLLDHLRFEPERFDRGFSFVTTVEQDDQFFREGEFAGFGFGFRVAGTDALEITRVVEGSPAAVAGFQRGFRVLRIDDDDVKDLLANGGLDEAFGPASVGVSRTFGVEDLLGTLDTVTVIKAVVTIDPVSDFDVFNVDGIDIGYLEFSTFIVPAFVALAEAFAYFAEAGVSDVIVDVRYNGGGLVSVADFLASLLAGPANVGEVLSETLFNSDRSDLNFTTRFTEELDALDLNSVVFIATGSTASASELVINSLDPYLDVALVGEDTFGKPVGQIAVDFCEETLRLRPVAFEKVNADGAGGYFDGLGVDCAADDDVAFPLGDPDEASLDAALTYVTTGACPVAAARLFPVDTEPLGIAMPLSNVPTRRYAGAY
jgi:C-terminal processing protease CtpA/Prc